jgi:hypothetical protein
MLGEFLEKNCPDVSVKIVIKHTTDWTEFIESVSFEISLVTVDSNRHVDLSVSMNEPAPSFSPSREISSVMGPTSLNTYVTGTAKFSA